MAGFFKKLVSGLTKTRDNIVHGIDNVFSGFSKIDDDFYEELEETLIMGDIGVRATEEIIEELKEKVKEQKVKEPQQCKQLLIDTIKEKMDLDIQVSKLKLMKANHTSQKYRLEDNITQHYPHQIAVYKERIEGFTADMEKYAKNKPEDKEQFFMQVGGKSYTDKKEAGTAIIAMCKEIKGINASADVGEYLGFKLNVTFDSFNNKFVMNVKGAMSHPMEVGSDPRGNITRINNVLEAMPTQLEEAQTKLSNVEHQLETAKAEVDKPFTQEAELAEKLERLAELNSLLNMDEKGDDAIGMDDEATEPEKTHEDVKSVDKKGDEVADMPAKQSNLGKTVTDDKLSDRPAERTSLKGKLSEMKARVSGTPAGRDAVDKTKKKEEIL